MTLKCCEEAFKSLCPSRDGVHLGLEKDAYQQAELGTKSVEALKNVEALHNGSTLIFPSKKPTLTVQRLTLKKIMLSALKFVHF